MSTNSQAFNVRRNITVGDPKTDGPGGPSRLPTVTCPGTAFVTRIDIRTRFNTDNTTQPIRYQWIKGLRVYCSNNEGAMPQGTLNWDAGVADSEANGPMMASGVKDVVAAAGSVVDHFGYGTFMRGNLVASWRQADVKEVRECVLAEIGATGGNWLFSLNLGFNCPDAPVTTTTVTPAATSTPTAAAAADADTGAGLGAGAVIGIVLGIGTLLAAVAALVVRQRRHKQREAKQATGMGPGQGPAAPVAAVPAALGVSPPNMFGMSQQPQAAACASNQFAAGQGHADAAWKPAGTGTGDVFVIGVHQQQQQQQQHSVQFPAHKHQQPFQAQHGLQQGRSDSEELFLAPPPASKGHR